jgi:hypothetical protein
MPSSLPLVKLNVPSSVTSPPEVVTECAAVAIMPELVFIAAILLLLAQFFALSRLIIFGRR